MIQINDVGWGHGTRVWGSEKYLWGLRALQSSPVMAGLPGAD